jgi:hypothetical protein
MREMGLVFNKNPPRNVTSNKNTSTSIAVLVFLLVQQMLLLVHNTYCSQKVGGLEGRYIGGNCTTVRDEMYKSS